MREIPLSEFVEDYERKLITDIVYIGNSACKVYGRSSKGQGDNPQGYEVVWASVP